MKKTIHCTVFLLLTVISLHAQEYLNLGFEKQSIEGRDRPWGWTISTAPGAKIVMDDSSKRAGKYSLKISSVEGNTQSSSSLRYWLQPYSLKNRPLRLKGWMNKKAFTGTVKIAMESFRGNGLLTDSVYKMIPSSERENGLWSDFDLGFSVSGNVHSVYITITVSGQGSIWLDEFALYSGKTRISNLPVAAPITTVQLKSLGDHVFPFDRATPVKTGSLDPFNDLGAFYRLAGNAQIIALGECTHGTSDFFSMKHRLLEFAVKKMKVGVFALEANQLNVELINDYVHTGKGDLQKIMAKTLFAVWNTREVFDLIEWVKWYNAQSTMGKISFMGYDMQDPSLPIDSLESFVSGQDVGLYPLIHRLLFDLRTAWQKQDYPRADDSVRLSWKQGADSVMLLINQLKNDWLKNAATDYEKARIAWAMQNARVIMQSANLSFEGTITYRDSCMAQNVQWILQQHPGKKMLLWAHDTHICYDGSPDPSLNYNEGITMGTYLRRKYDTNYRAFGFATYQGNYTSTLSYTNFRFVSSQLYPSPQGSLDEALHRLTKMKGSQFLIADLRPFLYKPSDHWMQQARPVRFITYASSDYGYEQYVSLPWQFDAIVFIDRTSGSKMLR